MKLAIVLVFAAVGGVILFGPHPLAQWRQNEEAACQKKCSELKKSWRLVPAFQWPQVSPVKFPGPWTCECY